MARAEAPREQREPREPRDQQKQQARPRPPQEAPRALQQETRGGNRDRDERRGGRERERDRSQRPGADSRGGFGASQQQNRNDRSRFRRSQNKPEEPRRPGEAVASSAIWAGWSAARFGGGGERD